MMNRSPTRWLGILLMAGCGVAGYAAGGGWDGVRKKAALAKVASMRQIQTVSRERRVQIDEFEAFETLLTGGKDTDIWKAVSRLPVARIPEALRRLRELRTITASGTRDAQWLDEIETAVYFHWAESDPVAALAEVAAIPDAPDPMTRVRKNGLLTSVMTAWMRTDPNTAYRAVKDDERLEYYGRVQLVKTWTSENVFENLKLYPENRGLLLGWYCAAAAEDPSQRTTTLQALKDQPKSQEREWGYQLLFRSWGYNDFDAAMAEAKTQELPEMVSQLIKDNVASSPQKVMPWAVKNDVPPGGPLWEKGYSQWLKSDRPGATQWFADQSASWESEGNSSAVAGFLAQDFANAQKMKLDTDQAAAAGKLTELMTRWKSQDPKAAAKWLETAPQAALDFLNGKGAAP